MGAHRSLELPRVTDQRSHTLPRVSVAVAQSFLAARGMEGLFLWKEKQGSKIKGLEVSLGAGTSCLLLQGWERLGAGRAEGGGAGPEAVPGGSLVGSKSRNERGVWSVFSGC